MTGWRCLVLVILGISASVGRAQEAAGTPERPPLLDYRESQVGNVYTYQFPPVDSLRLLPAETDTSIAIVEDRLSTSDRSLTVRVSEGVFRMVIAGGGERLGITIDNRLYGVLRESADTLVLGNLSGGKPPYTVLVFQDRDFVTAFSDLPTGTTEIPKRELAARIATAAPLRFQLVDADGHGDFFFDGGTIGLDPLKAEPLFPYVYLIPIGLFLVLMGVLVAGSRRPGAVTDPAPEAQDTAAASGVSGMRISPRPEVPRKEDFPFRPLADPADYLQLDLADHWGASRVRTVWMAHRAVDALGEFLQTENLDLLSVPPDPEGDATWEAANTVPEIGGMLLGQYRLLDDGLTYDVSLERFVPLEAKFQNAVKIEIDPLSVARDLGNAQDEHPELSVIAWFHTHPGHGLFLSRPDLQIQHSHFRKPYHLAMEIDSLSDNLDTAFFSYDPSGQMNNRNTVRPGTPWFSWHDISAAADPQNLR